VPLTTHSPALADATPLAAIPDVVVAYRDVATGRSALARLGELEDYAALIAQGPLGSLMSGGLVDRYVRASRNAAERERQPRRRSTCSSAPASDAQGAGELAQQ
jgi:hypothetical protein